MKKTLKMGSLKIQELLSRDQMKNIAGGYNNGCGTCGMYACYSPSYGPGSCICPIGGPCSG